MKTMTVADLIAALQKMPQDAKVGTYSGPIEGDIRDADCVYVLDVTVDKSGYYSTPEEDDDVTTPIVMIE